ncbi:Non-specific serine/threonine protein kinase [Sulfidibacter corallicola]|uniref:Protein kinase n=1 Tax=Sulfidibacter corallicola TaxID=2818388 RepID=A0A8A4TLB3_SULCO|nr:serine/threonine-protein kinase [Sulfidibacter corallicola]QTD50746.1 protein kinase [Sulfidibacter corallicola]
MNHQCGRYSIIRPLGTGGMGEVFLARDPVSNREVAVKVLKEAGDLNKKLFLKEVKLAASLNHENIVTIHDAGDEKDQVYVCMEYIRGETLKQKLARESALDRELALRILTQIADALDYAHRQGIVHGDLKPANIMVQGDLKVKIIDFGVARGGHSAVTHVSDQPVYMGTVEYSSPEQLLGNTLDGRADLYALGILAHELLWGMRPQLVPDTKALTPHAHAAAPRTYDDGIDDFFLRALHPKPVSRFENGKTFVRALEKALSGHDRSDYCFVGTGSWPQAKQPENSRRSRPFGWKPDRRRILETAIAVLGIVVALWGMWYQVETKEEGVDPLSKLPSLRDVKGSIFLGDDPAEYVTVALIGVDRLDNSRSLEPHHHGHFRFDQVNISGPVMLTIEILGYYPQTVVLPESGKIMLQPEQLRRRPTLPPVDIVGHITVSGTPPTRALIRILEAESLDQQMLEKRDGGRFSFTAVRGLREQLRLGILVNDCSRELFRTLPFRPNVPIDIDLSLDEHCREVEQTSSWGDFSGPIPVALLGFQNLTGDEDRDWIGDSLLSMLPIQLGAAGRFKTVSREDTALYEKHDLTQLRKDDLDVFDLDRIRETLCAELVLYGNYQRSTSGELFLSFCLRETKTAAYHSRYTVSVPTEHMDHIDKLVVETDALVRKELGLPPVSAEQQVQVLSAFSNHEAKRFYALGSRALREFKPFQARAHYQKAVDSDPKFALGFLGLSQACSALGFAEEAADFAEKGFMLSKALDQKQLNGVWVSLQGRFLETTLQWEKAVDYYTVLWQTSVHNDRPDGDHGLSLVRAQLGGGMPDKALATLDAIKSHDRNFSTVLRIRLALERALAHGRMGAFEEQERTASLILRDLDDGSVGGLNTAPFRARVELLLCAARVMGGGAQDQSWQQHCDLAAQIYQDIGDTNALAKVKSIKGVGLGYNNDHFSALAAFQQAEALFHDIGNPRGRIEQLSNIALTHSILRDLDGTQRASNKAIELAKQLSAKGLLAHLYLNTAGTYLELNAFDLAEAMYTAAIGSYKRLGTPLYVGIAQAGMGYLYHNESVALIARGEKALARKRLSRAAHFYRLGLESGCLHEPDTLFFADNLLRYARLLHDLDRGEHAADVLAFARLRYDLLKNEVREQQLLQSIEESLNGPDAAPNWVAVLLPGDEEAGERYVCGK